MKAEKIILQAGEKKPENCAKCILPEGMCHHDYYPHCPIVESGAPALFTANDIDGAYLLGVFNVVGLDGLSKEIKRIKKLGMYPHVFMKIFENVK
jgi:hypothetical protein